MHDAFNELQREIQYNTEALAKIVCTNVPILINQPQRIAYDTLMEAVNSGSCGIYFLDAPRGTGNMFLISLLSVRIR